MQSKHVTIFIGKRRKMDWRGICLVPCRILRSLKVTSVTVQIYLPHDWWDICSNVTTLRQQREESRPAWLVPSPWRQMALLTFSDVQGTQNTEGNQTAVQPALLVTDDVVSYDVTHQIWCMTSLYCDTRVSAAILYEQRHLTSGGVIQQALWIQPEGARDRWKDRRK